LGGIEILNQKEQSTANAEKNANGISAMETWGGDQKDWRVRQSIPPALGLEFPFFVIRDDGV
jgi:hypothetical protein